MSEKLLDRIGALLAKAESTDSAHEAEALVAKAQQLATLHAVDLASARERIKERRRRTTPVQRTIRIGRRGEAGRRQRVNLFLAVAMANDVRTDIARDATYVIAFGFPDDLGVVEALYASLATQMVAAANAAIRAGEHREEQYWSPTAGAWRSDARVFRTAFNAAFAQAVYERLQEARAEALAQHDQADGASGGGALVLARKADEVETFHDEHSRARGTYTGRVRSVAWSAAGHRSGHAAGQAAQLSAPRGLPGRRGELR